MVVGLGQVTLNGNFILSGKIYECPVKGIFTKIEKKEIEWISGEVEPGAPNYEVLQRKTERTGSYGTINITAPEMLQGTWEAGADNNGFWISNSPSSELSGGEFRFTDAELIGGTFMNDLSTVCGSFETYDRQETGDRIIPYPLRDKWIVSWAFDTPIKDINTDMYIGLPTVPKDKTSWLNLGFHINGVSNLLSSLYGTTNNPFIKGNMIETNNVIDYPFVRFPEGSKLIPSELAAEVSSIYISDIIDDIRVTTFNVSGNSMDTVYENSQLYKDVISGVNYIDNLLGTNLFDKLYTSGVLSGPMFGVLENTDRSGIDYSKMTSVYNIALSNQLKAFSTEIRSPEITGKIGFNPTGILSSVTGVINSLWENIYAAYSNAQNIINFTTIKYLSGVIPNDVKSELQSLNVTSNPLLFDYISGNNYIHNINMAGLVMTGGVFDYTYIKNNNEDPVEKVVNISVATGVLNNLFKDSILNSDIPYKNIIQPEYKRSWKENIIKGYVVNLLPEIPSSAVRPNTKIKVGVVYNEDAIKVWEITKSSIEAISGDLRDPEIHVSGDVYIDAPRYRNFDQLYLSGIEWIDILSSYQYYTSGVVMSSWMVSVKTSSDVSGITPWNVDGSFEIDWDLTDMGLLKEAMVKDIILTGNTILSPVITGVMDDFNTYYACQLVNGHKSENNKNLYRPYAK